MIPLPYQPNYCDEEILSRANEFHQLMHARRTVRQFSDKLVDRAVIEAAIATAGTAPSGANLQPSHFVAISDSELKQTIRREAEVEEQEFYTHRAPPEWLQALAPLGTDASKPFLEVAPWLIACFVPTLFAPGRWGSAEALLCCGISRDSCGNAHHLSASGGLSDSDTYP